MAHKWEREGEYVYLEEKVVCRRCNTIFWKLANMVNERQIEQERILVKDVNQRFIKADKHAGNGVKCLVLMASLYFHTHHEPLREILCVPLACRHLQTIVRVAVLLIRALTRPQWTELLTEALKVTAFFCLCTLYSLCILSGLFAFNSQLICQETVLILSTC